MKRSTFLLLLIGICAVPVYIAHRAHKAKLNMLAISVDAEVATVQGNDIEEEEKIPGVVRGKGQSTASMINKASEDEDYDVELKKKAVVGLVEKGLKYIETHHFDEAMSAITHPLMQKKSGSNANALIDGELYLFVWGMEGDMKGICFAHGQSPELIWQNKIDMRDAYGTYIIQECIRQAEAGGGWITYQWRNATKISYVKPFTKNGRHYLLGTGYYTHSKPDSVLKLVKGAVHYFNSLVNEGDQTKLDEAFSLLSYPIGRFLQGDLFLYALDFEGTMMANGERPGLIGTNALNDRDEDGKLYNQEIIRRLKDATEGIWIEYKAKNTIKRVFAEKIHDKKGKRYFIACGFYPQANRDALLDLVRRGYDFMKKHGVSASTKEFSDTHLNGFRFGDLYLFAYDMQGVCVAHGGNPDLVGLNQIEVRDEDGRQYVKEVIDKAKQGGGWLDLKIKNAFISYYVEKIDLGTESYVLGSGVYPVSRKETVLLLTHSAANYMRTKPLTTVFADLSNGNSTFVRGDLGVFVIGFKGIVRVYGDNPDLIWRNLLDAKDDHGKEYIKLFINTAKRGPGQITYTINGVPRVAFVEMVEKNNTQYVVGSGYYL